MALLALKQWEEFAGKGFPTRGKMPNDFCDWLLNRNTKPLLMGRPLDAPKKVLSPNYARIILRHIKAAFRWAHKHKHIDHDPFVYFEMPAPVKVARVLRPSEVTALLRELPDLPRRAFYFTLHTGLRISELLRLDWNDVERGDKWYLTVLKSKTRRGREARTKSQRIHPYAIQAMGEPGTGKVFPVQAAWLQRCLRRATKKLGLGRVRWHDLRHTWATFTMEQVQDLRAMMDAGGWETEHAAMVYQHKTKRRVDVTGEVDSPFSPEHLGRGGEIGKRT
jgi:integrase